MALVARRKCVLRYGNEAGTGDHRHTGDGRDTGYGFRNTEGLIADFWMEVDEWLARNRS